MAKLIYRKQRADSFGRRFWMYKVKLGFAATDGADVVTGATQATYALFSVPAGFYCRNLIVMHKTVWNASVTMTFGDGDDVDGYLTDAHNDPQTDDDTLGIPAASIANDGAYNMGHFYAAADTIDVVVAGANPSAGLTEIYAEVVDWNDFGRGVE